jgi:hypothetical protein
MSVEKTNALIGAVRAKAESLRMNSISVSVRRIEGHVAHLTVTLDSDDEPMVGYDLSLTAGGGENIIRGIEIRLTDVEVS